MPMRYGKQVIVARGEMTRAAAIAGEMRRMVIAVLEGPSDTLVGSR